MLYLPPGGGMPQRVHGAYVADARGAPRRRVPEEAGRGAIHRRHPRRAASRRAERRRGGEGGAVGEKPIPLYDQAVQIVLQNKRASISLVQRHLRIGYNRAARLIEDMEKAGLVSSMASNGNREIIVPSRDKYDAPACHPGERSRSPAGPWHVASCLAASASPTASTISSPSIRPTKTATARFEQQVFDRTGKVVERASGTFAFARPGKFRWTYEKPHEQVLVGDGSEALDPRSGPEPGHGEAHRQGDLRPRRPRSSPGKDDITALFTLRDAGSADGLEWVEATPKAQDTGFERVRLGLNGKTLAAMELYDQLGGRTMLAVLRPQGQRRRCARHVPVHAAQGRRRARGRARETLSFAIRGACA